MRTSPFRALGLVALALLPAISRAQTASATTAKQPDEIVALDAFRVTDRIDAAYKTGTAISATKTDTPLLELPQSVLVLPRQLIDDLGALDITDLYRNIAGVTQFSYGGVTFRGFRQEETRYNGVAGSPYGAFGISRLTNVEQVEVLKGPASVLYGSNQPGGILNIVTRRPRAQRGGELRASYGTGDSWSGQLYVTGPLDAGRRHLYLVAAASADQDRYRFNARSKDLNLSFAYSFVLSASTRATVEYERLKQDNSAHRLRGVPFERSAFLTTTKFTTTEASDFQTLESDVVQARVDHVFGPSLRFNATYRWFDNVALQQYHEPRGLRTDRRSMNREFRDQDRGTEQHVVAADLMADVATGTVGHKVLFGGEHYATDDDFRGTTVPFAQIAPIDIYNPVYGATGPHLYNLPSRTYRLTHSDLTRSGLYLQDQLRFSKRWHALAAVRYERFGDRNKVTGRTYDDTALTTRAGVVHKLRPDLALYASFAEGFVPQTLGQQEPGVGGPFDPEESVSYELGVKWEPRGGAVGFGVAAYEITKTNVLQSDPRPSAPANALIALGEMRSRGFEFEVNGQLARDWNVSANYAYNDAVVTADSNPRNLGAPFPNAPRHQLGAWTRYNFPRQHLGFGLGAEYVSTRLNFIEVDAFPAPGYLIWDAAFYYDFAGVQFTLRARNLFDRVYSQSTFGGRTGHFPGAPRALSLTAAWRF